MKVHPSAVVSPEAELAPDVEVGPHAVIESGVKIGAGTRIMAGAYVCSGTTLGENNEVHMHAVLGNTPQDRSFEGGETFLVIGEGNIIREMVTVHRGTAPGTTTRIGSGCMLMACSHVGHNCVVGDGVILTNGALLGGYVEVGERAFVSGCALVHQFTRVGRLAMVAGGARLTRDAPPFCLMAGENRLRGVNRVGIRRAELGAEALAAIGRAYGDLFLRDTAPDVAARAVLERDPHPAAREMAEFVLSSKRGVCRPARGKREQADLGEE